MLKSNAIANTLIGFGPIILLVFAVVATDVLVSSSLILILYAIGLSMLARSKVSLFRQKIWFSFGPQKLDAPNRRRYFRDDGIIVGAFILNLASNWLTGF